MEGWIKLHRKIQDTFLWTDKPFDKARAWIDLLLFASYSQRKLIVNDLVIEIERGSFMTSILKLSDRWGWSRNKTIAYIKMLEKEQMITTKSTTKGTIITIVKYEKYQQDTEDRTANNKKNKNVNKKNNIHNFEQRDYDFNELEKKLLRKQLGDEYME